MAEFDLIARIRERGVTARADVALGIGDDGAVLVPPPGQHLVAATDMLVEGVHFPVGTAASDIGWKALAVNLSDLAAMGATPAWALLDLVLPHAEPAFVEELADGFAALARRHDVALVGGDTSRGPLAVGVTVLGFVPAGAAITRGGARVGDGVFVTGTPGDAAAALCLMRSGKPGHGPRATANAHDDLAARLHRPMPRIEAGLALRGIASACIDVSDGLVADLGHVARASGVGIEIDAGALPLSAALCAAFDVSQARELALTGGDDYELAFTALPDRCANALHFDGGAACIGRVVAGHGVRVLAGGRELALDKAGWEHFG